MPHVIIVGGGYIGAELARELDHHMDVTLVEPREAFVHTPVMIRGVAVPELVEQALFPYDRLLTNGVVRRARVCSVQGTGVTLEDGTEISGDYIVIATGSSYAAPFKPENAEVGGLIKAQKDAHAALRDAGHIAIVGAGAVGTELAGEIKVAHPSKTITLISDLPSLFPEYPARLGRELRRKLHMLGVEVILDQHVENLASTTRPFKDPLVLRTGTEIPADVVFPAIGARPNTDLLRDLPGTHQQPDGRILSDRRMRPSDLPNVFAAGDAVDMGDPMTIVGTSRQVLWLIKTLKAVARGKPVERCLPYGPWRKAPILVPLGPQLGNSYLPPATVGNALTRQVKGKQLFLPKYRKLFRTGT
ncbi:NADH dehydrogenase FAD-containing subunit [Aliiruegeria haliotis]|uniref:NADH dehydrogenase FAD-containing subunit n=1 Tax=Aliiruegeria haliotis TaxID=1280846 RepID=A0A2T0RZQ2_9RHOB|nr:FAD-dependent oxidoreductase [Aliiruegeria haliotis]PRY26654.1 NADH dehydrogenase FAD-containing subunit [Aliiruegeria haliotis]